MISFIRPLFQVSGFTFLSRFLGYVRDFLIGSIFGNSGVSDVFFISFRFPNVFRRFLGEGALSAAFIPLFAGKHHKNPSDALIFARTIFYTLFCLLLLLVIWAEICMPTIIAIIAPGFMDDEEKMRLAIDFGRIMFPYIFFISLSAICAGMLQAIGRFAVAAAAPVILNGLAIGALYGFSLSLMRAGYALCVAVLISGALQLILLLVVCSRHFLSMRPLRPRYNKDVKVLFTKMVPGLFGAGAYQMNLLVSDIIASFVPMAVSYLSYAERINQFPFSIIGIAVATVLLPLLAKTLCAGKNKKALYIQNRSLEFVLGFTLPATVGIHIIALPIIVSLFEYNNFTQVMSHSVASVLSIVIMSLPANVSAKIFQTHFFAQGNTKTPLYMTLISLGVNIVLTLILFRWYSFYGIAVANVCAAWVQALCLGGILYRRRFFVPDRELKRFVYGLCFSVAIMGSALFYAMTLFVHSSYALDRFIYLAGLLFMAVVVYIASMFITKTITMKTIRSFLSHMKQRKA